MERKLIDIPYDTKGRFKSRENRFLGKVEVQENGLREVVDVHVRDPGRLKEILYPGNEVLLKIAESKDRKTRYDLIAGKVQNNWVLVNSGFHRKITESILQDKEINPIEKMISYKPEQKLGDSRIDFLIKTEENRIWVEVKGCTLAKENIALFPDAPTKRGKRHLEELIDARESGDLSTLILLIFRPDSKCFLPYEKRDPEFSKTFWKAIKKGVDVHPLLLEYKDGTLNYKGEIPICDDY